MNPPCPVAGTFSAAIRAERRGQAFNASTDFHATIGNGPLANWAPIYDTNENALNFGGWYVTSTAQLPTLRNTDSGPYPELSGGTPALMYSPTKTWLQLGDPTSAPIQATEPFGAGNFRRFSQIDLPNIMGPRYVPWSTTSVPLTPGWSLVVTSDDYVESSTFVVGSGLELTSAEFTASTRHTRLPRYPTTGAPATATGAFAPRTCNTSAQANCDTVVGAAGVATVPSTAASVDYRDVVINGMADAYTPYFALKQRLPGVTYGFLTGTVQDSSGAGIWGVPVQVDNGAGVGFEKITFNAAGNFRILLPFPTGTTVNVRINSQTAGVGGGPVRFYDPRFGTVSAGPVVLSFASNGADHALATPITLPTLPANGAAASGVFKISGTLLAKENGLTPLVGITMELRDARGTVLTSTETNTTGNYLFENANDAQTYYVVPTLNRTWKTDFQEKSFTIASADKTGVDFRIGGVPSRITIRDAVPGTLVMIVPGNYALENPPNLNFASLPASIPVSYSGVVSADSNNATRSITIPVNAGLVYTFVCWRPDGAGGLIRKPAMDETPLSSPINAGVAVLAGQALTGSCSP